MTFLVFLAIFDLTTNLVLLYNVPFWGQYYTPLTTLIWDVINERSQVLRLPIKRYFYLPSLVWSEIPTQYCGSSIFHCWEATLIRKALDGLLLGSKSLPPALVQAVTAALYSTVVLTKRKHFPLTFTQSVGHAAFCPLVRARHMPKTIDQRTHLIPVWKGKWILVLI